MATDKTKTTKPPRPLKVVKDHLGRNEVRAPVLDGDTVYATETRVRGRPELRLDMAAPCYLTPTQLRRLLPHLQAWCETGSLRLED